MKSDDELTVRGLGRDTLLPPGGFPFASGDAEPTVPAVIPQELLRMSVAEAFATVAWDGRAAEAGSKLDPSSLTVEDFFERFAWNPPA